MSTVSTGPTLTVHLDQAIGIKEECDLRTAMYAAVPKALHGVPLKLKPGKYHVVATISIVEDDVPLKEVPLEI